MCRDVPRRIHLAGACHRGAVGGVAGLIAGFVANASNLLGAILIGMIGGIAGSAIMRIAGAPAIASVGDGFSLVWAAVGGLLLGYVVGRSN